MAHLPDSSQRHLNALSPDIQDAAFFLVASVRNAGIPLQITASVRTSAEQAALVASGASRTLRSHHLSGQAFDVDVHGFARDEVPLWFWYELGQFAEWIGFRWGGRFSGFFDAGHFENPYFVP